ncbi:DNA translocase FtsK [Kordiimonas sp. SCSIO 12610]|uniref:DNA translocase FtsK n=1 Tax=Kordiimonas sp. SCSIO 12610 TaxID=2829597 RepID=UPI00210C3CF2|nr:DNA translocase FtsK [Kordiimonas sp. SCSIO 12610]
MAVKTKTPKKAVKAKPKAKTAKKRVKPSDTPPLLPPGLVLFMKNSAWRIFGVLIIGLAVAVALSLFSYNPADPGINNETNSPVTNLIGGIGANVSDVLMQSLGLVSYFLIAPILFWGVKLLRLRWLRRFWLNLASVSLALVLFSIAFSVMAPSPDFPVQAGYGGALGQQLYLYIVSLFAELIVPAWVYGAVFALLAVPVFLYSLALNRDEWAFVNDQIQRFGRASIRLGAYILTFLWDMFVALKDRFQKPDPVKGARLKERDFGVLPEEIHDDPIIDEEQSRHQATARKRVKAPKKAILGKREAKEAQTTLNFGDTGDFVLPALELLEAPPPASALDKISEEALEQNARMLEGVLGDFGVQGDIQDVRPGPVVTLYELEPARGTKSARVIGLADDIARSMSAISARVAVVSGRNAIGIELPNTSRQTVFLRELLASRDYERNKARLPMVLGKDIGGAPVVADLSTMPHLLVAGTTGSGKSVGINTMILSLLYRHSPDNLRFIMVDPKMLELSIYDGIPHLLTPVVTEPKKAVVALKWAVREMEERYRNMSKLGVRNLAAFNKRVAEALDKGETLTRQVQTGFDKETGQPLIEEQEFDFEVLPYIVIVIDEMADLMLVAGKDVEATVQRLAQMARAAGIHLIMATQRPSVDVITGTIKANFPTRISFQVTSKIDSRTILGEQGAEQLLGMGDMLYMAGGGRITRVHGAFVADKEVETVVGHLKRQGAPDYLSSVTEEPEEGFDSPFIPGPSGDDKEASLYDKAVDIVLRDRRASTSYIQRRLKIGYNKAATLIEEMEEQGVISAPNHKGQREILVPEREDEF